MGEIKCSSCGGKVDVDNGGIIFGYGRGNLCKVCYKYFDLATKLVEKKYRVRRGFVKKIKEVYYGR